MFLKKTFDGLLLFFGYLNDLNAKACQAPAGRLSPPDLAFEVYHGVANFEFQVEYDSSWNKILTHKAKATQANVDDFGLDILLGNIKMLLYRRVYVKFRLE
jgi:hypothetical protein